MVNVLFVGAHPDDVFFACGGTIAKLRGIGKKIYIISLSHGNKGDTYLKKVRDSEFRKSLEYLKVEGEIVGFRDMHFSVYDELVCKLGDVIKNVNPEIIVTHNKNDLHLDHVETNKIVSKAVSIAFNTSKEKLNIQYLGSYQTIKLNLKTLTKNNFNFACCIDDYYGFKKHAISLHRSQLPYLLQNMETISMFNKMIGNLIGKNYAEGYQIDKIVYDSKNIDMIESLLN